MATKMGVKVAARAFLVDVPAASIDAMRLPPLEVSASLTGQFDYIHLFTTTQQALDERFPVLRDHLATRGMLWVSWPRGDNRSSDLTLPVVIRIGYSHGLVESTCLRIDQTWSGLKFTHPKPGKNYQNSYGTLPSADLRRLRPPPPATSS